MAKRIKLSIDFKQFGQMLEQLDRVGKDVKPVVNECLEKSRDLVTNELRSAMNKHHRTGKTLESLRANHSVKWTGDKAMLSVGFNVKNGGLPSVFLMYGTPRVTKDTKLYNAIYGARMKRQIKELQAQIFNDYMQRVMGGGH